MNAMKSKSFICLPILLLLTQLAACHRQPARYEEPVRMVKLITADAAANGGYRFIGVVRQRQRAELSFENGGRLATVQADVGDPVRRGQLLATMDAEPALLQVRQADARLRAMDGQLRERRDQYRQQQAMHDDGATSPLTLNAAKVALDAAEAEREAAATALQLSRRAQRNLELRAPFDGRVSARPLEPGALAAAGQAVLGVEGNGSPQVVAALPVNWLPPSLKVGAVLAAHPAAQPGQEQQEAVQLTLRSLADRVDAGGTVQAIFDVPPGQAPRRSGEALSVSIPSGTPGTLTLPLTALAQGATAGAGHVFVYHPSGKLLEKRPVELGKQFDGRVEILKGLQASEQVAGAGTAFLIDHQRILPYQVNSTLTRKEAP